MGHSHSEMNAESFVSALETPIVAGVWGQGKKSKSEKRRREKVDG